ncbi:lectin-like domain-containing protein [Burkholderia sp. LMU1-1-1.1]|uniref:PEP-CTERM sorting domain-containing protein n=1 Tax=Burkholderia sp. LMU1-1-1.1 TaxID=3135266 RepID=UPI0034404817
MPTRFAHGAIAAAIAALFSGSASAASIDLLTLNRVGSATMAGGDLQLTRNSGSAGAGWLTQTIPTTESFSATFSFSLLGNGFNGKMADGIALVFQNQGDNVVGNGGGDLGYWNIGGSGASAVGSIIRSWDNNAVGLSTNGVVQGVKSAGFNLGAANYVTGTETVTYNALTHELTMGGTLIDHSTGLSYAVSDAASVDLNVKYGGAMYIGFTGGTGGSYADQRITGFSVSAVPEPATYAMLMGGLGLVGWASRRKRR